MSQSQFRALYGRAKTPSDLPWYREEPQDLLVEIAKARDRPRRALDVGCGSGMHSVWLARHGWQVTGIDFMDRALEMARERSQTAGTEIHFEKRDVLAPTQPTEPFDLVLDVGCLHSWKRADHRAAYRANLMSWLAPAATTTSAISSADTRSTGGRSGLDDFRTRRSSSSSLALSSGSIVPRL